MIVVNKTFKGQERLAKDDIDLLIDCVRYAGDPDWTTVNASHTRLEMLIEKLNRMKNK